ncbi:MAG TPA: Rap1a/Tai family immunity protein [Candidatus Binatia bacterium]|jgi:hypothetical protein
MPVKSLVALILFTCLTVPAFGAVTDDDFMVRTTANLVNLCAVRPDDPRAKEAIQMCHGYMVGAFHYEEAELPAKERLVCLPQQAPTRNESVAMFVEWAKAHPQYMKELPVETQFRFLTATWPCKS